MNGQFKAREDAINLLLKTFKRTTVQGLWFPRVPNVIRLLAAARQKVEVYVTATSRSKFGTGTATPSHTGTYMPPKRRQERRTNRCGAHGGFTGFLSTRFFTNLEEWRYTGMFDPLRTLQSVKFTHAETRLKATRSPKAKTDSLGWRTSKGSSTYLDTSGVRAISCVSRRSTESTTRAWKRRCKTACGRRARFCSGGRGCISKRSTIRVHWKYDKA